MDPATEVMVLVVSTVVASALTAIGSGIMTGRVVDQKVADVTRRVKSIEDHKEDAAVARSERGRIEGRIDGVEKEVARERVHRENNVRQVEILRAAIDRRNAD